MSTHNCPSYPCPYCHSPATINNCWSVWDVKPIEKDDWTKDIDISRISQEIIDKDSSKLPRIMHIMTGMTKQDMQHELLKRLKEDLDDN